MKKIEVTPTVFIGDDKPAFIIAEAGSNHNMSLDLAKELIDAAAEAKANAVKFQLFSADKHYSKRTPKHSSYNEDLHSLIKSLEMPRTWVPELAGYAERKNILFFATPSDYEAVDILENYSSIYKIASFEIVDLELVRYCASKGKPIIISTGLANMEEIEDAYKACLSVGNSDIAFLQCASVYPAPPKAMNLNAMDNIRNFFNVPVGLSDHTLGIHIPVAAVAMGASIIEKHFTLDKNMDGPDHPFAINPVELKEMVSNIRDLEDAMGNGMKLGPSDDEMEFYIKSRRSLHVNCKIEKGQKIEKDMLISKRPGLGIKPKYIGQVVGRTVNRTILPDEWITWEMFL